MNDRHGAPDPYGIHTLEDLTRELAKLRRRAAGEGQVRMSVRDVAQRVGKAPSTLDPYLRGLRLCPMDTYEGILRALGVGQQGLRPWLDAWERVADARTPERRDQSGPPFVPVGESVPQPDVLTYQDQLLYELTPAGRGPTARLGIVTGDVRRVTCAHVWVNPENTAMRMARVEDFSVSAIIRYRGARRDASGAVVDDCIADDLERAVAGRRPVPPGTAIVTGSGELARSNGVRAVIHVASVHGEPGEGYRQVRNVGLCVTNALAEAEQLEGAESILFPLLGAGMGGGAPEPTVTAMLGAAVDRLATVDRPLMAVYLLAYTARELAVCRAAFESHPRVVPDRRPVGG